MALPLVLAYNLDSQKKLKLRFVCAELKIHCLGVQKADYGQPLAALAGLCERTTDCIPETDFSDEMLVMANFSSALFHSFLDALRLNHIQGIPLKAVLTPTNSEWNSVKLHAELLREHDAIHRKS